MKLKTTILLPMLTIALVACGKDGVSNKQPITRSGVSQNEKPSPKVQTPATEDQKVIKKGAEEVKRQAALPPVNPPMTVNPTIQPVDQPGDGVNDGEPTDSGEMGETTTSTELPTGLFLRVASVCEFIGPYQEVVPLAYPFEFLGLKAEESLMSISLLFYHQDDAATEEADEAQTCQITSIHDINEIIPASAEIEGSLDAFLFNFKEEKNSNPEVCNYELAESLKDNANEFLYRITRSDMIEVTDTDTNECMVFISYDSVFF